METTPHMVILTVVYVAKGCECTWMRYTVDAQSMRSTVDDSCSWMWCMVECERQVLCMDSLVYLEHYWRNREYWWKGIIDWYLFLTSRSKGLKVVQEKALTMMPWWHAIFIIPNVVIIPRSPSIETTPYIASECYSGI